MHFGPIKKSWILWVPFILPAINACKKDNTKPVNNSILQLISVKVGTVYLDLTAVNTDIPVDHSVIIAFSSALDTTLVRKNITLTGESAGQVNISISYLDDQKTVVLMPGTQLMNKEKYTLSISGGLKGINGEAFPGIIYHFTTVASTVAVNAITVNGQNLTSITPLMNIDRSKVTIDVKFAETLDPADYTAYFTLSGGAGVNYSISPDSTQVELTTTGALKGWTRYYFTISNNLTTSSGSVFGGFTGSFYTKVDSTQKFPTISDDALLTLVEQQTFRYFWDFAHPDCGMARERNTSGDVVTTGGSGFGVMALIVGMDRGFITRSQGLTRLNKILGFLETCDRYHGAWPHWLNGVTGKTVPFSTLDDGADLVETSYMVEGLLTMRQYLDSTNSGEDSLIRRINTLCDSVQYDWFTQGQNVLYWHWSPDNGWAMNMKIQGYNETLITYIVAATSTQHPISANVYKEGYTRNGAIVNGRSFYGYLLPLGSDYGGPLFFTHYSFLGLDPRNLQDNLASYWQQNVDQALINWSYCVDDPKNFIGYSPYCWGLTASDNPWGYSAHSPTNDLGVIAPTAAVSSLPYTPVQSMNAIRFYYYILGDKLWGDYGFYDAFDPTENWWANSYLAIDEGPVICMIENYRTGLLWNLFMSCPEVQSGLTKLGFTY